MQFKDRDTKERDGDEARTVTIRGTPEAAQLAELRVREVIANLPVIRSEEIYVPVKCLGRIIGEFAYIVGLCRSLGDSRNVSKVNLAEVFNRLNLIVSLCSDKPFCCHGNQ